MVYIYVDEDLDLITGTTKFKRNPQYENLPFQKGDKVDFTLSVDTLVKMGALQYNEMFKAKDAVIGRAEILDVFTKVQDVDADYKNETEKEKKKEIAVIKDYLAKNKINAVYIFT